MTGRVSIGVAGALGPEAIARLAPAVEAAGFAGLWVNDTPDGDALVALAAAAAVTDRLILATGVIPVDRRPAEDVVREVVDLELPQERLVLGIGSGVQPKGALARVGDAVDLLRGALGARVMVGALGPKMRHLGAERADGVLLNWVPPGIAAAQAEALHAASADTHVAVYVRTAVDPAASRRLDVETARYASYPNYAANFARMGVAAPATTFRDERALVDGLPDYRSAVDEVVLRAITADDSIEAMLAFIARAAPVV
ncbi:LLM class flavin-dependent oxidoreductase [Microbacterium sp. P06]|uniref:LLM class flavin-dependent oxidoreductase n=1 Tax=Microbacterium sp. P06 TaxID=3366949 RepID=UPI00374669BC